MYFDQDGTQHKRKYCSNKCKQGHYRRMKQYRAELRGDKSTPESAPIEQVQVKDRAIEALFQELSELVEDRDPSQED